MFSLILNHPKLCGSFRKDSSKFSEICLSPQVTFDRDSFAIPNHLSHEVKMVPAAKDYDELLNTIGGFGRYQLLLFVWYQCLMPFIVTNLIFMVFGAKIPDCQQLNTIEGGIIPNQSSEICVEQFHSLVSEWSLTGAYKFVPSLMTSVQMTGLFFGSVISGFLSDQFGRKSTLLGFLSVLLFSGLFSAFARSWQEFTVFRAFIGLGLGGAISVREVLLVEYLSKKNRSLLWVGSTSFGYFAAGVLAWLTADWKKLTLTTNFLGVLPIFWLLFLLDESPKWLLEKNRLEDAMTIFRKIAIANDAQVPDVSSLENFLGPKDTGKSSSSYRDLFYNWQSTIICAIICFSFFTTSTINYGVLFYLPSLSGKVAANTALYGIIRMTIQTCNWLMDQKFPWYGRRFVHQLGLLGSSFCLVGLVFGNSQFKTQFALGSLSMTCFLWNVGSLYCVELFPTLLRSKGSGLCYASARIGGILAPQLLLLKFPGLTSLPQMVFLILAISNSFLAFNFLPETKGKPLAEMQRSASPEKFDDKDV